MASAKRKKKQQPAVESSPAETQPAVQPRREPVSVGTYIERLGTPLALMTLAAASSPISQATLAPVFGSIPSAVNHQEAIIATTVLAFTIRHFYKRPEPFLVAKLTAAWAFWIPLIQFFLFKFSGILGPKAGPGIIGFLSCHTILIPTVYSAAEALEALRLRERFGLWYGSIGPAALALYHLIVVERWFQALLPGLTLEFTFFAPVTLQLLFAAAFSALASSKALLIAVPALLHTIYLNPHFDSPTTFTVLNNTLAQHNWTVLDRRWSNTGYLSVLENTESHYRLLRCDHSILGGEWRITDERRNTEGWSGNEPVYPAFEMLEAVRLLHLGESIPDSQAQALVIGLGIGTAPSALIAHGIKTTIVEIDPAIHDYATKYFDLPASHTPILANAVTWVNSTAASKKLKYDYILHDVFTGGAEPLGLFTLEFLQNLRSFLKPNGALALNYAGVVTMPLTAQVLNTIDRVFEGHCKIFRDSPAENARETEGSKSNFGGKHADFTNMIIFCRNTAGPVLFRKPTKADVLQSKSRERFLLPNPDLQIDFPLANSANRSRALQDQVLRAADTHRWSAQQIESATRHWYIMREVLPDAVWELW